MSSVLKCSPDCNQFTSQSHNNYVIIVHGGAGAIHTDDNSSYLTPVKRAAQAGYAVLRRVDAAATSAAREGGGNAALDAVIAAVKVLEAAPGLNAGLGSCLDETGEQVSLDALIQCGQTSKFGAVTNCHHCMHPIGLARLVMDRTRHASIIGDDAHRRALRMDQLHADDADCTAWHENAALISEPERIKYARSPVVLFENNARAARRSEGEGQDEDGPGCDTVGAVALDAQGNIATANSTGGLRGKLVGRISDSSVNGAGSFSTNGLGGVTVTGNGDHVMRTCLSHRIICNLEMRANPSWNLAEAMVEGLQNMGARTGGVIDVGGIGVDPLGRTVRATGTECMPWAEMGNGKRFICKATGNPILHYGFKVDDDWIEEINTN